MFSCRPFCQHENTMYFQSSDFNFIEKFLWDYFTILFVPFECLSPWTLLWYAREGYSNGCFIVFLPTSVGFMWLHVNHTSADCHLKGICWCLSVKIVYMVELSESDRVIAVVLINHIPTLLGHWAQTVHQFWVFLWWCFPSRFIFRLVGLLV